MLMRWWQRQMFASNVEQCVLRNDIMPCRLKIMSDNVYWSPPIGNENGHWWHVLWGTYILQSDNVYWSPHPYLYSKNLSNLFRLECWHFFWGVLWSTRICYAIGITCSWGENRYCKHWPFRWCTFWVFEEKHLCAHNFNNPWRWWPQMHHMSGMFIYCYGMIRLLSTFLTVTICSNIQLFSYRGSSVGRCKLSKYNANAPSK